MENANAPRHIRAHGGTNASINSDLSALWASGHRNHAHERLRGLLRLQGLRKDSEAASRELLCFLFVWLGAVSTNSTGCRTLLHSEARKEDRRVSMTLADFLTAAHKLANDKARELGWIV